MQITLWLTEYEMLETWGSQRGFFSKYSELYEYFKHESLVMTHYISKNVLSTNIIQKQNQLYLVCIRKVRPTKVDSIEKIVRNS